MLMLLNFLLLCFPVVFAGDIFAAVRANDAALVKEALMGASINTIGPGGQTPLMHAVLQGKAVAVEELLRQGADVTIGEKDGYTPMHGAGFQGRAQIAKALIAHGLDPNDTHRDGYSAIHRACWGREKRHTATVRVLLDAGVAPFKPERPCGRSETTTLLADALSEL